ncbi:MAG: SDR family oxidoreductase [Nitrosomonadales bacterium]|nr:SDR family oxidoreductase [Nitrosomonadales bacterium]
MTTQSKGTAVITGASSGIGAVYADRLAKRGYDLILVARDTSRLAALSTKLQRETGRMVDVITADLTEKSDLRMVEEVLREDKSIHLLLNNAGTAAVTPLVDSDMDKIDSMIQLNITALTRLAAAAASNFVAQGNGTIINIASIVALAPEMLNGSYSGSKAYVLNLSESMHHELSFKGVRVQAVLPGATSTELWDRAGFAVSNLPQEIVMSAEDMVDAALVALDQGEVVTIPSLPEVNDWQKFTDARLNLHPNLSHKFPAQRYLIA